MDRDAARDELAVRVATGEATKLELFHEIDSANARAEAAERRVEAVELRLAAATEALRESTEHTWDEGANWFERVRAFLAERNPLP